MSALRLPREFSLGALGPWWQRSRIWWTERSLREQILLGVLSAVGIVALLLVAVIAPLRSQREAALANIRNASLLEARLRTGGPDLARGSKVRRGTSSAIITDSISAAQLTIQRIEPEGGNTRIVLGDAGFDKVVQWVADIEATSRLRVVSADIQRSKQGGAAGLVSASFVLGN